MRSVVLIFTLLLACGSGDRLRGCRFVGWDGCVGTDKLLTNDTHDFPQLDNNTTTTNTSRLDN